MCSATKKLSKRVRDEKGFGVPCPLPYTWDWKMEMIAKKILKDVAEQESAKQEDLVVERAYKALRRNYDTKIDQE